MKQVRDRAGLLALALVFATTMPGCMTLNKSARVPMLPQDVSDLATIEAVHVELAGITTPVSRTRAFVPEGGTLIFTFSLTQLGVDNGVQEITLHLDGNSNAWTAVFPPSELSRKARISIGTAHIGLGQHVISMRLHDASGRPYGIDKVAKIIVVSPRSQW